MRTPELLDRLEALAGERDMGLRQSDFAGEWPEPDEEVDAVELILRFMERHPNLDYGTPGPLVHFVERFCGQGYEQRLVESISRKPTSHTVWMLNRVIHGTVDMNERQALREILQQVVTSRSADAETIAHAARFFARLSN